MAHVTLDTNASAMGFNDCFDKAEAKAEAALRTAFVAAVKALPDFALLFHRNANARVAK
jgi:hypothetical protein